MAKERVPRLAAGVEVSADVRPDEPVAALLEECTEAALLVLGPRGHGPIADMLLGSVSLTVAARAHCPVVVTRGEVPAGPPAHGRIGLGIGATTGSTVAAHFAFGQARSRGCEIVAVRAWSYPTYENMPYAFLGGDQARERAPPAGGRGRRPGPGSRHRRLSRGVRRAQGRRRHRAPDAPEGGGWR
nr:universal stress protein [Streptomyces laculatispora]